MIREERVEFEASANVRRPPGNPQVLVRIDHSGAACLGEDPSGQVSVVGAATDVSRQAPQLVTVASLVDDGDEPGRESGPTQG
ncbi:hypothetical protein [Streptomyces vastus]|uniref:Uncharacterized protein n=1 Tax=Streptomyces vastus TaxID=285451 RepID=A0ABN3QD33_9ACTN